jgi:tetratricopeptide (TPR) repeat protein
VTARLALGRHLDEKNDYEGARRQYRLALTYNPKNPSALNELGYFYLKREDADHAIEILERSKEVDKANATTRYYLGMAHFRKENTAQAEEELWAALAFKPDVLKYYHALARVLEAREKHVEAISVWEEVLKKTADEGGAQKVRAHIGRLAEKAKAAL